MPIEFKLNGEDVIGCARRDDHPDRRAHRRRDSAPLLQGRHAPRRQLPRVHGRNQGRARAGAVVLPPADGRHGSARACSARAVASQKMVLELLLSDMPEERHTLDSELDHWAGSSPIGKPRFARAQQPPPTCRIRHGGQSRFLHPVHALRARVPRRAGERRHRLRISRRAFEDRVRSRRSDGRFDVRRVRRMRAGVPDRRADAGARRGGPAATSRCTPYVRTAASAASSRTTSRTTRSSSRRPRRARRTTSGCASKAATVSTTSTTSSG